jgi:hypothetical protein
MRIFEPIPMALQRSARPSPLPAPAAAPAAGVDTGAGGSGRSTDGGAVSSRAQSGRGTVLSDGRRGCRVLGLVRLKGP